MSLPCPPKQSEHALYTLNLTIVARPATVRQPQIIKMFDPSTFIGRVRSIRIEAAGQWTTTVAITLTTFASVSQAKQHIVEHLERAPAPITLAELTGRGGRRTDVYCPRRADGCMKIGDHRGDCFSGAFALVYLLSVFIDPAGPQVNPNQIRDVLSPYLEACDGELRDAYTSYTKGAEVIAVFTADEDPQVARTAVTQRLKENFPVPMQGASLLYEVPDIAEYAVDLLKGKS